jgi:hypothetical protein
LLAARGKHRTSIRRALESLESAEVITAPRDAPAPAVPSLPPGVAEDLQAALATISESPCTYWACHGSDAPIEDMVTCAVCAATQYLRAALSTLGLAELAPGQLSAHAGDQSATAEPQHDGDTAGE